MKRWISILILAQALTFLAGCNHADAPVPSAVNKNDSPPSVSANTNGSQPQASNSNATAGTDAVPIGPGLIPQAVLQGTYAISEVQHDGLVEMISPENTTEITFIPPATFSRISKKNGKVNHTDSGEYNIFGTNGLILKIMMSKQRIQTNPVVKRHPFTLSSDGNEFRLTSEKGKVAVFRRIKQAPDTK
jgi:hypothetical protein